MTSRIGRHLRSQFVGYIALVLAMSGTAYAVGANSIGDKELANNSVGSSEIEPQAVKTNDLAEGSVGVPQWNGNGFCFIGQIMLVGFDFVPTSYYAADGGAIQIESDEALYSLYGNQYGGNESQGTFGLPNINAPQGTRYIICSSAVGIFPERS